MLGFWIYCNAGETPDCIKLDEKEYCLPYCVYQTCEENYYLDSGTEWTLEDLFNSDTKSTGNLNGQDGWTVNYGTVNIVNTNSYDGDQSIQTGGSAGFKNSVDLTEGILYFSGQATNDSDSWYLYLYTGTTEAVSLKISNLSLYYRNSGGGTWTDTTLDVTADTWFRLGVDFDTNTDTFKLNLNNGSWTDNLNFMNTVTVITIIEGDTSVSNYYDTLSPNYTITEAPPAWNPTATSTKEQFEIGFVGFAGILVFLGSLLGTKLVLIHLSK